MFDKKAIGHEIEWVIGIGLFLLSLLSIFVLFKPGVTPVFDSETLINIVQDNMKNHVSWEITKIPIFMETLESKKPGSSQGSETEELEGILSVVLDDTYLNITGIRGEDGAQAVIETRHSQGNVPEKRTLFLTQAEYISSSDANQAFAIESISENNIEMFYIPLLNEIDDPDAPDGKRKEIESNPLPRSGAECLLGIQEQLVPFCEVLRCLGSPAGCVPMPELRSPELDDYGIVFSKTSDNKIALKASIRKDVKTKYVLLFSKEFMNLINPSQLKDSQQLYEEDGYLRSCVVLKEEDAGSVDWKENDACKAEYSVGIKEKLDGISI